MIRARHLQVRTPGYGTDYRDWPQEALSDLARVRRGHEFLKVLADAVKAKGIATPITDQRLAISVARYLTVVVTIDEPVEATRRSFSVEIS